MPALSFKDLFGQRFGRFVVISRAEHVIGADGDVRAAWTCQCDCGNVTIAKSKKLVM
jgi:hypothetical protein